MTKRGSMLMTIAAIKTAISAIFSKLDGHATIYSDAVRFRQFAVAGKLHVHRLENFRDRLDVDHIVLATDAHDAIDRAGKAQRRMKVLLLVRDHFGLAVGEELLPRIQVRHDHRIE